jgi:hypothetical protein
MVRPLLTVTVAAFCFATPLLAQSPPSGSATSAPTSAKQSDAASSPAKSIGMFAYPKNQQSSGQQLKDENECFASSKQQSRELTRRLRHPLALARISCGLVSN